MKCLITISFLIILISTSLKAQPAPLDSIIDISLDDITLKQALNKISEQKSRRRNRLLVKLNISDQNVLPVNANLSATVSPVHPSRDPQCDIKNYLYFGDYPSLEKIDLSFANDLISSLIDNVLITTSSSQGSISPSLSSGLYANPGKLLRTNSIEEPLFAEINVSGNFSADKKSNVSKMKNRINDQVEFNNLYWIPKIEIDEHGSAQLEYRVAEKNKKIYVHIQGVSASGLVECQIIEIDPHLIKFQKD